MLDFGQIDREIDWLPYEQIARMLRGAIISGQLAAGKRLPADAKLAEHFGVARMTVRRAVQELRDEGLVVPAGRRGVIVRPTPSLEDLWPRESGDPPDAPIPNAPGDVAPEIAQAENFRTQSRLLNRDLTSLGLRAGDPLVEDYILRTLAGAGYDQADMLELLAMRLHRYRLDPAHVAEIDTAFETARQAFVKACAATYSVADALRRHTLADPDVPVTQPDDPSSLDADD